MPRRKQMTNTDIEEVPEDSVCSKCKGLCCRYITVEIDPPEDEEDLDNIRWYMIHKGVSILIEDEKWYVKMDGRCQHLLPNSRCGIYDSRPQACRDYDTDNCDYRTIYEGRATAYKEYTDFDKLRRSTKKRWAREAAKKRKRKRK